MEMNKTYEEQLNDGFCEYMRNNHCENWMDVYSLETVENIRCEFYAGAEWHAKYINNQI